MVLEIGTGTGILAMMAARAGAQHVYTIEVVPAIAEAARRNIAANGFADRVTVIAKDANDVEIGEDIPERCNVFLHEIVDNILLGEAILPLTRTAREKLLTEGAVMLPERIWASGMLVDYERADCPRGPVTQWDGIDLSAIDLFAPNTKPLRADRRVDTALTAPTRLIEFDLRGEYALEADRIEVPMVLTAEGAPKGLVQWIGFGFPGGLDYEVDEDEKHAWSTLFHPLGDQPVRAAGDKVTLRVDHNHLLMGFSLPR